MPEPESRMPPDLIVISGVPGTGKSTLAGHLRQRLCWPAFNLDRYKEAMFDASGIAIGDLTQDMSRRLGAMAEAAMLTAATEVLLAGQSCIVESFFRPEVAAPVLGQVAGMARARQVLCITAPGISMARYRERYRRGHRHPVHLDHQEAEDRAVDPLPEVALGPVPLAVPLLTVDTSAGYSPSLDEIIRFCQGVST